VAICAIFVYATMEHEEQQLLLLLHLSLSTPHWNMQKAEIYIHALLTLVVLKMPGQTHIPDTFPLCKYTSTH